MEQLQAERKDTYYAGPRHFAGAIASSFEAMTLNYE